MPSGGAWDASSGGTGEQRLADYLLLRRGGRDLLLSLLALTLLLLVQMVVQPLQVAGLASHWATKRTLRKMREQERNG